MIELFQRTGADVLSVDWRVQLDEVWTRCKETVAVQGNLNPIVALVDNELMEHRVRGILATAKKHKGHIFSLGHGVLQETKAENLRKIVQMVHHVTYKKKD
ncbi:hypothetical protein G4O51_00275 [Candidatus Bathyarchaeota archaeon A05DMB-2]|jgi:uroporphyrinogen decarboxylase|nr:hypothetical protein [Candidatus Bathyarchaeota archaeon A05DMB-2]